MKKSVVYCLVSLALAASPLLAEPPNDFHVESDRFDMEEELQGEIGRFQYRYIQWLLEEGYPVPSIILHAVSRGMPISDVVYMLTRADVSRAAEFYNHAIRMLPELPSWVCEDRQGLAGRYFRTYPAEDLGPRPTVRQVAERYFEDGARLAPFPRWREGKAHLDASIGELLEIAKEEAQRRRREGDQDGEGAWWYRPGELPIGEGTPLFVSLYPTDRLIAVDATVRQLMQMQQRGATSAPVVILFNRPEYIPLSDVDLSGEAKPQQQSKTAYQHYGDGVITATEVINRYLDTGDKVTPVREWKRKDHHLLVDTAELDELFELSRQGDVPPQEWQRLLRELQAGAPLSPLLITVHGDTGEKWIDQPELAGAAKSLGVAQLPVVFLLHEFHRLPCGIPSACEASICEASQAAGGGAGLCQNTRGDPLIAPRRRGAASDS